MIVSVTETIVSSFHRYVKAVGKMLKVYSLFYHGNDWEVLVYGKCVLVRHEIQFKQTDKLFI